MAAATGRKTAPRGLKVINGQGQNSQGEDLDSGGRPIGPGINFRRLPPDKPEDFIGLDAEAEWLWDLIVDEMGRVDLLKPLDAASLRAVCETWSRYQAAVRLRRAHGLTAENSQGTVTAPWIGIEERAGKEFRAWCAEYGLTPAAEAKLRTGHHDGNDDSNPF